MPAEMQGEVHTRSLTLHDAATADGNGTPYDTKGFSAVSLQVVGSFIATLNFCATIDDTKYDPIQSENEGTGEVSTQATTAGLYLVSCVGKSFFRVEIEDYAAGSVTVVARGVTVAPAPSFADVPSAAALASQFPLYGQIVTAVFDNVANEKLEQVIESLKLIQMTLAEMGDTTYTKEDIEE